MLNNYQHRLAAFFALTSIAVAATITAKHRYHMRWSSTIGFVILLCIVAINGLVNAKWNQDNHNQQNFSTLLFESNELPTRFKGFLSLLFIDTYIHTYIHTYIRTYILLTYIHTNTCLHIYIHTYIPTCIPSCIHTYIYTYIHTYLPTCIPSSIHTYVNEYILTYI